MPSSGHLAARAKKQLRYFRYFPPQGGFGGDWDNLTAVAPYADDAELHWLLETLGYKGTPPLEEGATNLGFLDLGGFSVMVRVLRNPAYPGATERQIQFDAAVYVTEQHIADTQRLENWLDAHRIPMAPAS
jgi:hypothetical protein